MRGYGYLKRIGIIVLHTIVVVVVVVVAQESNFTYAKFAAAEAELDALNEIGFANTKTSDEEYVRLMMMLMIFHPPLVYVLYHAGVFDAIL